MQTIQDILSYHLDDPNGRGYDPKLFFSHLYESRPEVENKLIELTKSHDIVNLYGLAGIGKTTLIDYLLHKHKFDYSSTFKLNFFDRRIESIWSDRIKIEDHIIKELNSFQWPWDRKQLMIFDNIDSITSLPDSSFWNELVKKFNVKIILASRFKIKSIADIAHLKMKDVDKDKFSSIFQKRLIMLHYLNINNKQIILPRNIDVNELLSQTEGSIRNTLQKILDLFILPNRNSTLPTDLTSNTINVKQEITKTQEIKVKEVNEEIINECKKNPNFLYQLSSRKFEEIIANIFENQGFDATLTPQTRDGGFDIFLSRSESFGDLLYVVECKKNSPNRKVGIDVIRQLYGVVERNQFNAGLVVTTSFFSNIAKQEEKELNYKMHLNDFYDIKDWLEEYKFTDNLKL